jgi:ribosomal protein L37AE/L43A
MGFPSKVGIVKESVYFNGYKYNRYPESKRAAHQRYFTKGGGGLLHRHIWEFHNGEIRKGHHIHHKDGNFLNNDISNLECLESKVHYAEHKEDRSRNAKRPEQLAHLDKAREKASEWHGSPEGLEWHSKTAKAAWENRGFVTHTCQECKNEFQSRKTTKVYYCSGKCSATAWRKKFPDYYSPEAKAKRLQFDN